ncbi:MAG: YkvA family protein [Neisseria sp.]|nr:YkvA family protein [Neisseria sp.]
MGTPLRKDNAKVDRRGFWQKIGNVASHLGGAALEQVLTLYYVWAAKETPWRSKVMIAAALAYFVLPFDAIPDFFAPLGFTDDLAVIGVVYTQIKSHISNAIRLRARSKADEILRR